MYGTYSRLNVTILATNKEVIKAARKKLKNPTNPTEREQRKKFYRMMLEYHHSAQRIAKDWRLY